MKLGYFWLQMHQGASITDEEAQPCRKDQVQAHTFLHCGYDPFVFIRGLFPTPQLQSFVHILSMAAPGT